MPSGATSYSATNTVTSPESRGVIRNRTDDEPPTSTSWSSGADRKSAYCPSISLSAVSDPVSAEARLSRVPRPGNELTAAGLPPAGASTVAGVLATRICRNPAVPNPPRTVSVRELPVDVLSLPLVTATWKESSVVPRSRRTGSNQARNCCTRAALSVPPSCPPLRQITLVSVPLAAMPRALALAWLRSNSESC